MTDAPAPPTTPSRRERAKQIARVVARSAGTWALFLLLPFAVLWKIAPGFTETTIGNDYTVYPLDGQIELLWAWSKGMFPLYIPGFDGGNTIAAMTLAQVWHPITWLCGLIPPFRTGSAEVVVTVLRLLELGFTHAIVYRATRESGLRRTSSFVLSFVVVFNGRMLDSFRYGPSLEGYCGMLLACAAFASGFRRGWSVGRISLAAIAVYLTLVSGHPQWALFATTGAGLFAACLPLVKSQLGAVPTAKNPWWKFFLGVGASSIVGVVLSAGYLLPFLREFMPQNGDRVNQEYSFTLGYGDTVRGVLSNFVRPLESDVHGAFGGGVVFLALVLAVPALFATRRRFAIGVLGPVLLLAIAILFAMGDATPVHRLMVENLPLFSSFRTPGRATLWIPPMMLLLGWVTLADLDRSEVARSWMRVPVIAIGGALAFVTLLVSHFVLYGQRVGDSTPGALMKMPWLVQPLVFAFAGAGAAMLAFLASRSTRTRAVAWALLIASVVCSAGLTMSFGTWLAARKPSRKVADVDASHRKSQSFVGDAGYGLGTKLWSKAEAAKIPARREPGAVVEKATFVPTNDAAIEAVKAGLKPNMVVLTGPEVPIPYAQAGGPQKSKATFINWNRWAFHVNAPRGGVFVFGHPAMNEWRATIDGVPAEIRTANAVFASVLLEPGEHDVEFRYESRSTKLGAAMFFGGFALMIGLNGFLRGRRGATLRRRIAWWAGAAVLVGLVATMAVVFFKRLDPAFNIVDAPPIATTELKRR